MEPFYFGPDESLFGIYHPPRAGSTRDLAVVLCYPLFHEYVSALRAYRALANNLAKRGLGVLRFDWYGSGDSAGGAADVGLERWLDDVESAVDHLRATHGTLRFALVGLRMGATLATLAAARLTEVELLALWEPVTRGDRWLRAQRQQHHAWLAQENQSRVGADALATPHELLGYALPPTLAESLETIDLDARAPSYARRCLVLQDGAEPVATPELTTALGAEEAQVDHEHAVGERIWGADVGFGEARVPATLVATLSTWVDEASR